MDWNDIIKTIATNTVFLTVLGFVAKSIYGQILSKDLKKFEIELQATHNIETEKLRSALSKTAFEYQTRFARLHEKRADILADFYKKLVEVERVFGHFVIGIKPGQPVSDEKAKNILGLVSFLWDYFEENRIYFEPNTCEKVFRLLQELNGVWGVSMFAQVEDGLTEQQKADAWQRGWKSISNSVPELRRDIENDFRKLLGAASDL